MRKERDFLGELEIPDDAYYGVQTMRAMENFHITGEHLDKDFIHSMGIVKKAAALANMRTGRLDKKIGDALVQAADDIINGKLDDQFPLDPIQGGAGTSVNMNTNEVLCNRALEIIGEDRGRYDIISPNNHANMAQSTNDAFPTGIKVCISKKSKPLMKALSRLADELDKKGEEFKDILKVGRTHLQDAVPITLGQEMHSYASAVRRCTKRIEVSLGLIHTINMGGTAIGTGLNAEPAYIKAVAEAMSEITGEEYHTAPNMIDGTNNTDVFADTSAGLKGTALILIKMANDFRLMGSGPRCGFDELKIPPRQPGSSIMPGKVNPVIAEVLDQACYQVIANDMAVTLGVENGQLELNVMEPVISFNLFNSFRYMTNAVNTFTDKLLLDLKADEERCKFWMNYSICAVTALLPHVGYEKLSPLAKESYETGRPIMDIVREHKLLPDEDLERILKPENMTTPGVVK